MTMAVVQEIAVSCFRNYSRLFDFLKIIFVDEIRSLRRPEMNTNSYIFLREMIDFRTT